MAKLRRTATDCFNWLGKAEFPPSLAYRLTVIDPSKTGYMGQKRLINHVLFDSRLDIEMTFA